MDINLSTGAPPDPALTLQRAGVMAELARVLNHATMDHGALKYPAEADRLLREIATTVARLPQLLEQLARWVAVEDAAGRIGVPSGEWAGRPHTAVTALQARLDYARASLGRAQEDVEYAAHVTNALAAADPEDGDDGG